MTIENPHAPACDRNRDPILEVLHTHFTDRRHVLEIGSGTGQHAVHFGAALPHLQWQTSECREHHDGIRAWLTEAALTNRSDEHTSELQSLMRISYAVFCLKKKKTS